MLRQGSSRPATHVSSRGEVSQPAPSWVRPRTTSVHDSEPELDDYVPPPPKANIGDLLAQALEMSTLKVESSVSGATPVKPAKKGRKMKGQKINLTGGGARTN